MIFFIWFLLIAIGVSDVQKQLIPNRMVVLLLVVIIFELFQTPDIQWWLHIEGFLFTFIVGFGLYLTGVMAGGDVKLLAVIGLWLGATIMWQVTAYMIVAGGIIGVFYLVLHLASSTNSFRDQVKAYLVQKVTPGWESKQALVIPFAPAIVIGVAYYFYIY